MKGFRSVLISSPLFLSLNLWAQSIHLTPNNLLAN